MQADLLHCQLGISITHRQQSQRSLECLYRCYAWTLLSVVCKAAPMHIRHHLTACVTSMAIYMTVICYNLHVCIAPYQRACPCILQSTPTTLSPFVTSARWRSDTACCLNNHALLILMLMHCPSTCMFGALSLAAPDVHYYEILTCMVHIPKSFTSTCS